MRSETRVTRLLVAAVLGLVAVTAQAAAHTADRVIVHATGSSTRAAADHAGAAASAVAPAPGLEALVAPVALYPDAVLGLVLPAAAQPAQVAAAGALLDALDRDAAATVDAAWDDPVIALLNYPEVLTRLNADPSWTRMLGRAVVRQETAVVDAAGRFRGRAYNAGVLRSDDRLRVYLEQGTIRILPAHPEVLYVPDYDPLRLHTYRYFPRPYPVYYHPYGAGHYLTAGRFWGLSRAFGIAWESRRLQVRWLGQGRPYHGRDYDPRYDRDYRRWGSRYGATTFYGSILDRAPGAPPPAAAPRRPRLALPPTVPHEAAVPPMAPTPVPAGAPRLYGGGRAFPAPR